MSTSPRLGIPYMVQSQSQKEVTHNEAINILELIVQSSVLSIVNDPPGTPAEGVLYIVGNSPTGSWTGKAKNIVGWLGGVWKFLQPREGWHAWVQAEGQYRWYHSGAWEAGPQGPAGATGATGAEGKSAYQVWLDAGNAGTVSSFLSALKGTDGRPGLIWRDAWLNTTTYNNNDAVSYGGSSWIALQANTGQMPATGVYWALLAAKGTDGNGSGDMTKNVYDTNDDGTVDKAEVANTVKYIDLTTTAPVNEDILMWDSNAEKFKPSDILARLESALVAINGV